MEREFKDCCCTPNLWGLCQWYIHCAAPTRFFWQHPSILLRNCSTPTSNHFPIFPSVIIIAIIAKCCFSYYLAVTLTLMSWIHVEPSETSTPHPSPWQGVLHAAESSSSTRPWFTVALIWVDNPWVRRERERNQCVVMAHFNEAAVSTPISSSIQTAHHHLIIYSHAILCAVAMWCTWRHVATLPSYWEGSHFFGIYGGLWFNYWSLFQETH